jgi:hypothetical protein
VKPSRKAALHKEQLLRTGKSKTKREQSVATSKLLILLKEILASINEGFIILRFAESLVMLLKNLHPNAPAWFEI